VRVEGSRAQHLGRADPRRGDGSTLSASGTRLASTRTTLTTTRTASRRVSRLRGASHTAFGAYVTTTSGPTSRRMIRGARCAGRPAKQSWGPSPKGSQCLPCTARRRAVVLPTTGHRYERRMRIPLGNLRRGAPRRDVAIQTRDFNLNTTRHRSPI